MCFYVITFKLLLITFTLPVQGWGPPSAPPPHLRKAVHPETPAPGFLAVPTFAGYVTLCSGLGVLLQPHLPHGAPQTMSAKCRPPPQLDRHGRDKLPILLPPTNPLQKEVGTAEFSMPMKDARNHFVSLWRKPVCSSLL